LRNPVVETKGYRFFLTVPHSSPHYFLEKYGFFDGTFTERKRARKTASLTTKCEVYTRFKD